MAHRASGQAVTCRSVDGMALKIALRPFSVYALAIAIPIVHLADSVIASPVPTTFGRGRNVAIHGQLREAVASSRWKHGDPRHD